MAIKFQRKRQIAERRRAGRDGVQIEVTMRERGRSAMDARISEMSVLGCRIECGTLATAASQIWMHLPGVGRVEGRVVWERDCIAGIAFDTPLHHTALAQFGPVRGPGIGVRTAAPRLEAVPKAANDSLLTRREQIVQGIADTDDTPLRPRKAPTGAGIMDLVTRTVPRQASDRYEPRHPNVIAASPGALHVGGSAADLLNVSASGLKVRANIVAGIGEPVAVEFEGFPPYSGRVAWIRGDEIGIDLPPHTIDLHDND